jgi:hypothetical protein
MAASVVLENLPKDATRALETAGELGIAKGLFIHQIIPVHLRAAQADFSNKQ